MMAYIDREKAQQEIFKNLPSFADDCVGMSILKTFKNLPTEDVAPVVRGEWEQGDFVIFDEQEWICSNCGGTEWRAKIIDFNYCPYCGARMDVHNSVENVESEG